MAENTSAQRKGPSALFRFFFIDHIFSSLLGILLVLGGLMAYSSMVKEASPDLEIPMAMVRAQWPGAAPELMEKEVTTVLEKAIKSLNDIKQVSSGSRMGQSVLLVEFTADAPVQESISLLRSKVAEAAGQLPAEVRAPSVEHVSTTDTPVLTYMLHGDIPDGLLGDTARTLKDRLERIGDIRKVELSGAREDVVRVVVSPLALSALDMPLSDVRNALQRASMDVPLGEMQGGPLAASISLAGRFEDIGPIASLPLIEAPGGHIVRLSDVAEIRRDLSTPADRTFVSFAGQEFSKGVSVTIYKNPGTDTLAVVDAAKAAVAAMPLPAGLEASVLSDQSVDVSQKLNDVFINAGEAIIAVVAVLLLALSWRAAVMAGVAVPITFLGAVATVYAMGMTMNQMVVIGMVLALGLLVDVFILVMEGMHQGLNIERRSFASAARETVRRYALPAFAGQVTTILALAPLLFLGGVSGKFIRLVPMTAIICLLVSYAVAFIWMLPMSRMVMGKPLPQHTAPSKIDVLTDRAGAALSRFLHRWVLRSRMAAGGWMLATVALIFLSFVAAGNLPGEMYPKEDGRNMGITVDLPPGTPLEQTAELGKSIGTVLLGKDYIDNVILYAGRKSPYSTSSPQEQIADTPGTHTIGYSVTLTTLDERDGQLAYTYVPELRDGLREALKALPGATLTISAQTGGPGGGDALQYEIQGEDLAELRNAAEELRAAIAAIPGTTDVRDDLGAPGLAVAIIPNRTAMEFFSVPVATLADEMALALGESTVAKLKRGATEDDIPIQMSLAWPSRGDEVGPPKTVQELSLVRIRAGDGKVVEASSLFNYDADSRPQLILHGDGTRTVTVRAKAENVDPGFAMATLAPRIEALQARYPDLSIGLAGAAKEAGETGGQMMKLFLLTLVLMFAVLVMLFNSYRLPFIILFTVPCALVGTFGGFFVIQMPLSFPAMVGIVSLLGIVVNVSIVMIETMRDHRAQGKAVAEAAAAGAADRLRPIISTGLTTIAGLVLLSMSSPMWQPLCYAIIFGLIAATVLSMVVIPALFLLLSPRRLPTSGKTEDEEFEEEAPQPQTV